MPEQRRHETVVPLLAAAPGRRAACRLRELGRHTGGLDRDDVDGKLAAHEHRHEHHRSGGDGNDDHDAPRRRPPRTTTPPRPRPRRGIRRAGRLAVARRSSASRAGMGHGEIGFVLKNTGSVELPDLRVARDPVPRTRTGTRFRRSRTTSTNDFFGSTPAVPLVIAPGASSIVPARRRPRGGDLQRLRDGVRAPGDPAERHRHARVAIPNGAYECQDANVSPLRSGDSAYP